MALVLKTNPVGIDSVVNDIQTRMYNYLISEAFWTKYESYHRAYINPKGEGTIPEIYTAKNEYKTCLMDDKNNVTSFFLQDEVTNVSKGSGETYLSIVFQCDLRKLYPSISHRADAEFRRDVYRAIKKAAYAEYIETIITGVENVYSDMNIPKEYIKRIKLDDMSNYHVLKVKLKVNYSLEKC